MASERSAAPPPFGLALRLWLVVLAVALAAAWTVADLGAGALRDRQEALRTDRVLHIARDLRIPLEGAVALGLPLEQAPRVQDMLEREQVMAGTLSIEVFDPQGRILYGTDRSFLGDLVADRWMEAARAAGSEPWTAEDPDALVVGAPVANSFGAVVGTIAVRHAKVPAPSPLALLGAEREVLVLAVGGVVVFAGLAFLILSRLLAPLGRDLAEARAALARPDTPGAAPLAAAATTAARALRDGQARRDRALDAARRADADAA